MTMMGADPDGLDRLAGKLKAAGSELDQLNRSVVAAIRALPWRGKDAIRFESEWRNRHGKATRQASTTLFDNAAILRRNANEQRYASAAETGPVNGHSSHHRGPEHYGEALANYFGKDLPMSGAKRSSTMVEPLATDAGIIVARFFIPDKTALSTAELPPFLADDGPTGAKAIPGLGPDVLRGDHRGFSMDPSAGYRLAVAWNTATGEVTYTVMPSEDGEGKLYPARPIDNADGANRFAVDETGPGSLTIDYHGLNSRTRALSTDGTLALAVERDGDIRVRVTGDDYPSFEAIQYTPEGTYDLGQDNWRDGGPPVGEKVLKLAGILPRDREWVNGDEVALAPPPVIDLRPSVHGVDGEAKVYLNPDKVGVEVGVEGHHAGISVDPGDIAEALKPRFLGL